MSHTTRVSGRPLISSSRKRSSNGSLSGQRRAERDGWATPCGLTCLEVIGRSDSSVKLNYIPKRCERRSRLNPIIFRVMRIRLNPIIFRIMRIRCV
jgi:hypothetical protein